jgi:peptide/nickel transport system permease protein
MGRFLLFRVVRTLPAAWAILSIIFLLSRILAQNQLRLESLQGGNLLGHTTSSAQIQAKERQIQKRLGLDLPLFYLTTAPLPEAGATGWRWQWNGLDNQYHIWLQRLCHGDLGRSFRDQQPVTTLLFQALASTLPLTVGAFLVVLITARGLVVLLAQHQTLRPVVLAGLHVLHGLPLFVVSLALLLLLANPDILAWFPAYGLSRANINTTWGWELVDFLHHLALPLLSLVLVSLPSLVIQLDNALQHELRADYVVTARAKGLTRRLIIRHHALRNALLPAITYAADLLPALVAGAVVVELIFALPGMGRLLAEAAAARDLPVLLGGVLLITLVRLLAQVLADWLYFQADPRIRLEV